MIDVRGDDGSPGGNFRADELSGDFGGDALGETAEDRRGVFGRDLGGAGVLFVEVIADDVLAEFGDLGAAHVFPDGDELHLRGDDALAGIPELRHRVSRAGAKGLPLGVDGRLERAQEAFAFGGGVFGVLLGEVTVVAGFNGPTLVFLDVASTEDPSFAQRWQTGLDGAGVAGVAPGTGGVVNADRFIHLDPSVEVLGRAEGDFPHRNADIGVDLSFDVNSGGCGQRGSGGHGSGVKGERTERYTVIGGTGAGKSTHSTVRSRKLREL